MQAPLPATHTWLPPQSIPLQQEALRRARKVDPLIRQIARGSLLLTQQTLAQKETTYLIQAQHHAERGEWDVVATLCDQGLALNPKNFDLLEMMIYLNHVKGDWPAMLAACNRVILLDASSTYAWVMRNNCCNMLTTNGLQFFHAQQITEAKYCFQLLVEHFPVKKENLQCLAACYYSESHWEEVIECYTKMCLAGLTLEQKELAAVNYACDQVPDSEIAASFYKVCKDLDD